jgi:hypothetical protein
MFTQTAAIAPAMDCSRRRTNCNERLGLVDEVFEQSGRCRVLVIVGELVA